VSVLAIIRPDDWNLPLLVHVFGAMVLVGALVTSVLFGAASWRPEATGAFGRLTFRTLLYVALPAWIVMRVGAQWVYDREAWGDAAEEPFWLGIGWITGEGGGLLLLIAIVLAGLGTGRRRVDRGGGTRLTRASVVLAAVVLAAYVFTAWAMSGKPE
jgi:hypothetical protein